MNAYEILKQPALGNDNYFNPNPNSSVAPVVETTVGMVSVNQQDKVVNDYVYGKKFRAILAAEGWAIVDSAELEFLLRSKYLITILQVGIFNNFYDAQNFMMQAAVAYGVSMLGVNFRHYFNWPSELKVNAIHYFDQRMVAYIANRNIDYYDTAGLPQLKTGNCDCEGGEIYDGGQR